MRWARPINTVSPSLVGYPGKGSEVALSAPNVIALVTDAGMFPAAAFLAFRLRELNPRDDTEVVIFSDSGPDLLAAKKFEVPSELMYVDFSGRLPAATDRIPGAAFFRLFLPEVLGVEVKRILYLDVDIAIENATPFRLFDLDMGGHAIAAVRDLNVAYAGTKEGKADLARTVGSSRKYLLSGAMLIDRQRYLDQKLRDRIFGLAFKHHFHDQSATNLALKGDWLELSQAMNMINLAWNSFVRDVTPPAIVHFMGPNKPWHATFGEDHPIRTEMQTFFKSSPWPRFFQPVSFAQAWNTVQAAHGMPTAAAVPQKLRFAATTDYEAIARHLRETRFADVDQGITEIHLDRIPEMKPAG